MGKWRPCWTANDCATGIGIILRSNPALPEDIHIIVCIYSLMYQRRPAQDVYPREMLTQPHEDWFKALLVLVKSWRWKPSNRGVFLNVFADFQESLHFPLEIAPASPFSVYTNVILSITCLAPNSSGLHTCSTVLCLSAIPHIPWAHLKMGEATEQAQPECRGQNASDPCVFWSTKRKTQCLLEWALTLHMLRCRNKHM